jgi:hypothetical protein
MGDSYFKWDTYVADQDFNVGMSEQQTPDFGFHTPMDLPAYYNPPRPPVAAQKPADEDKGCPACKATVSVKRKTSYGPLYTTQSVPVDGSQASYGFGVQSNPSFGVSSPQLCTTYGESPGVASTVSGSAFGGSLASQQSFAAPLTDAAHSFQVCAPVSGSPPSFSPGVSIGVSGIK